MYGTHGSEDSTLLKISIFPYCGQPADAQWIPCSIQNLDVKTDDATHAPKGCEIIIHITRLPGENKEASQMSVKWLERMGLGFHGV